MKGQHVGNRNGRWSVSMAGRRHCLKMGFTRYPLHTKCFHPCARAAFSMLHIDALVIL